MLAKNTLWGKWQLWEMILQKVIQGEEYYAFLLAEKAEVYVFEIYCIIIPDLAFDFDTEMMDFLKVGKDDWDGCLCCKSFTPNIETPISINL